MATIKDKGATEATSAAAEARDEVQAKADEALAKGYIGEVPDPHPNAAYSIQTGPDSPPVIEDNATRFGQPAATKETKTDA